MIQDIFLGAGFVCAVLGLGLSILSILEEDDHEDEK